MTIARTASLVWMSIRRARRQFVLSAFGIAVGIASLAFFSALSAGVRQVVLGRVFRVDRIEVEPAKSGGLDLSFGLLGGGPAPVSDETVARLGALPGVRSASPRMRLAFPAKAWGGAQIFGSNRYAELLGDGVDPAAVAAEAASFGPEPFADLEGQDLERTHAACQADADCTTPGEYCAWDVHRCEKPVPALVSRYMVELYNGAFAASHNMPRLSDFLLSRFKGFTFTVELGTSFVGPRAARGVPRQRRVMLVGVSDRAVPIGLSFPLAYVRRWNAEYAGEAGSGAPDGAGKAAGGYTSVTLDVADRRAITSVAAAARGMGLTVVDSGAEQAGLAITLVTLLFGLVSLAILAVATINIAHTFFRVVVERRREIGVMRSVGASAGDIQRLLLGEAASVGLVGGIVGLSWAWLLAAAIDQASRRLLPEFPFKPETYFRFSPALVAGVVGFAVAACLLGAAWPARRAARMEPADAMTAI
jgi:ABC-type lipoprotein release transport system permease subunit